MAGAGIDGIAAAKLILERGGDVVLYDGSVTLKEEDIREEFDRGAKVNVVPGEIKRSDLLGVGLCIIGPDIPLNSPFVFVADDAKIPILGETELAYQCDLGKLAAITGTNGKTTTTALTGETLEAHYEETSVAGNTGNPYIFKVLEITEDPVTVAGVSGFQLETIMDFKSNVSAILNITPDHLSRHGTMENYIRIKECITLNQVKEDAVVPNYDDSVLRESGQNPELKPRVIWFSDRKTLKDDFCMDGDDIVYYQSGRQTTVVNVHDIQFLKCHSYENVMAAVVVALEMGVSISDITRAIEDFHPVEHRIEFVRERTGVRYYNGSKGTNPDTAIQALRVTSGPTPLVAGGYGRDSGYDKRMSEFEGKVGYLVPIGQTRDKIAGCAKKHDFTEIMCAEDMQEAVQVYAVYVDTGDYVLLNPARANWGMFKNYEKWGCVFEECIVVL